MNPNQYGVDNVVELFPEPQEEADESPEPEKDISDLVKRVMSGEIRKNRKEILGEDYDAVIEEVRRIRLQGGQK